MNPEFSSSYPSENLTRVRNENIVAMNEALVLGTLRQHELMEAAEELNVKLQAEICARRKMVRELTEKARLLDLANDAIIVRSFDGEVTSWNKGAEKLFGWNYDEVIGININSFLRMDSPEPRKEMEEKLQSDGFFVGEIVLIARNGRRIPSFCRWVLDRETKSILTSYTDITERKQSDEALRESEERFRTLFASVPMGVYACDRNGLIQQFNPRAVELWGRTPVCGVEQYCGALRLWKPDGTLLPVEQSPMIGVLYSGVPAFNVEVVIERPDGSRAPVLFNFAALKNGAEEITGAITSIMDLTERKKLEQQFLRSQRMESLGTLAGGIAHDLNNALGPIVTGLDFLKMRFPDPESQELLELIDSSAQRGADMVRQVLTFARGVEGQRTEVRIQDAILAIEKIVKDAFLNHTQLQTCVPDNLWTVLGDATQIHQVLINLCLNARDAMPTGGTLVVSAENCEVDALSTESSLNPKAKPGPYVLIVVKDSGAGMSSQLMENIFDPFFTTKEMGRGTGLGLSTSLAIVKSHGGFLHVASELGKGTTFQAFFPAKIGAPTASPTLTAPEKPRGDGELVLVVDDEEAIREITKTILETFGYRVVLACDGAEAVAQFAKQSAEIDLVITDMTMPVMDGPEAIQILRSMKPDLPIIGASGLTSLNYTEKLKSLGVKHILPKPYTTDSLLKTVRLVLSSKNDAL